MTARNRSSDGFTLDNKPITFLTMLVPPHIREEVRNHSMHYMMDAADVLEWNIYAGLTENIKQKVQIINILPIGSYPQYYKKAFVKRSVFSFKDHDGHINIGFCNIKLLRKLTMHLFVYKELDNYYKGKKDPGVLLVYSAEAILLRAVKMIKRKYPSLIVCDIVADLPDMISLSSSKSLALMMINKYLAKKAFDSMSAVDCFVLLTDAMARYMDIHRPYTVMEGIATLKYPLTIDSAEDCDIVKIVYSGTLHKRFGILHLLNAFTLIKKENYRLVICGVGDSEQEILDASKRDDRIVFLGQLPREDVLRLQMEATVLVNPRQNHEVFTKYSFPSKILEYLSSGKPVVAYKLDGIPDDYDRYLCYPSDDSVEALSQKLMEVCEMESESRKKIGEAGKNYVAIQKNAVTQTGKIIALIEDVLNK